jgi:hypothetical protein
MSYWVSQAMYKVTNLALARDVCKRMGLKFKEYDKLQTIKSPYRSDTISAKAAMTLDDREATCRNAAFLCPLEDNSGYTLTMDRYNNPVVNVIGPSGFGFLSKYVEDQLTEDAGINGLSLIEKRTNEKGETVMVFA